MKIDFCKPLINFDGKPFEEGEGKNLMMNTFLGRALGNHIGKGDEVMKYFDWAQALMRGESLSLDRADQEKLKNFITNNDGIYVWSKGQLLEVLNTKPDKATSSEPEESKSEQEA